MIQVKKIAGKCHWTGQSTPVVTRREFLRLGAAAVVFGPSILSSAQPVETPPDVFIGYTELRTNLPGGRHANVTTMRAAASKADGSGRRTLAEKLTLERHSWSQFAGWSPNGGVAIIGRGWESPENGKWEEEHKTFHFTAED